MDYEDEQVCRICMNCGPTLDWREELFKSGGISYKDCYYRYTQLKKIVSDKFSQLLCGSCATDLKTAHLLIEKAVETHKLLNQMHEESNGVDCPDELKIECVYMVEDGSDHHLVDFQATITDEVAEKTNMELRDQEPKKKVRKSRKCTTSNLDKSLNFDNAEDTLASLKAEIRVKEPIKINDEHITQQVETIATDKGKTKATTPVMCSYCSKIIHNAYYLKKHEQTHQEDREREVTCSKCGLKTFNKKALYIHMKIHDKNREKKFKCEFCDKAFFHRGACNVHRRIHLGQMVKCPICPKEFYRQVDLDRHMQTHSNTPLHTSKPHAKLKYVVHCKECNKEISSAKFNAHRAYHMNEPLMRCTVCEKDFFSRMSCTRHMRRVHKRAKDNYDDITTYFEKYRPRLSHVLMEQQEEVETKQL